MSNRTFLGKVGTTPKGEWSANITYERLDWVTYQGSSYIALMQNTNSTPSDSNPNWMIAAKHGEFTEEQLEEFKAEVVAESKQEMDDYTDVKKGELDTYEGIKETELNTYTGTKKGEITELATNKTNDFNDNATSKTTTFNNNAQTKQATFDGNATSKTNTFNQNASDKTDAFNSNATQKTTNFNDNATSKTTAFDNNASSKTTDFNTNATNKTTDFNDNAEDKTQDFDQNAQDKTDDFDDHVAEYTAKIEELEQENKDLRNSQYKIYTETPSTNVTLNKTSKNKFIKFGVNGNREQETYEGYQLIDNSKYKSSFTHNGLTYTPNANGSVKVTGTATATSCDGVILGNWNLTTILVPLDTTKQYTLSLVGNTNSKFKVFLINYSSTIVSTSTASTFTPNVNGATMMMIKYSGAVGDVVNTTLYPMLIEGSYTAETMPEYEPYTYGQAPNTSYECPIYAVGDNGFVNIEKCNKNKCNITAMYGRYFSSGILGALANDKMIIDNFDSNNITFHSTVADYLVALTNIIKLQPNTEYIIKFGRTTTATNNQWFIYDYDDGVYTINYRANNTNVLEKTFTTNSLGQIVLGFGYGNASGTTTISNIQIELGSTATSYTQHQSETFNMPCQKPMVDEADYFDRDNEKEVHGWKKLVLDGTENWAMPLTNKFYVSEILINPIMTPNTRVMYSNAFIYGGVNTSSASMENGKFYSWSSAQPYRISIASNIADTLQDWKAWLAEQYANGTPVYIIYQLDEPEKLPFTQAQKAVAKAIEDSTSYYEQTNVYSNDNVSPILDITAVGDQNLVIDSIDARLSLVE